MLRRRSLLLASGAGALLAACGGDSPSAPARPGVIRADIDRLNELLAFEHLEAAFYRAAAAQDPRLETFATQEAAHVEALTRAVRRAGGRPVAAPREPVRLPERDAIPALALRIEERRAAASLAVVARIENAGLLAAGLSMHAVEARHVIAMRDLAGVALTPTEPFGAPLSAGTALAEVRAWLS